MNFTILKSKLLKCETRDEKWKMFDGLWKIQK